MYFHKLEHSGILSISVTEPKVNTYGTEFSVRKKAKEKVALWQIKLPLKSINEKIHLLHSHGMQYLFLIILLVNVCI